jgi:hypothetical protein
MTTFLCDTFSFLEVHLNTPQMAGTGIVLGLTCTAVGCCYVIRKSSQKQDSGMRGLYDFQRSYILTPIYR